MKKYTKIGFMTLGIVSFMALVVVMEANLFGQSLKVTDDSDRKQINGTVFDNQLPVVKEETNTDTIIKPYTAENVKVSRSFYNYDDENKNQENSIYYYGYTYMQNEGIDYSNDEMFDVVSILDGKVISITNDEIYGNTIKINHSNGIVSVYQFLSQIDIKQDDVIKKGTIIGKSGTSKIDNDENSYLHFELIINSINVNPDLYFNKSVKDI